MAVSWPAGHRWEDYQVKIFDKARTELGALGTVRGLRGDQTLWGQFGAKLTFSLNVNDPWATVLKEAELHFVQVLRDGVAVFEGYQVTLNRDYDNTNQGIEEWIEFEFLPLAHMARWRAGLPIGGATTLAATGKVDNVFKAIVHDSLGADAPNTPTSGLSLVISGLSVAANKTEHPDTVTLDATKQVIYEWLQLHGVAYDVDWDINFDSSHNLVFETWYPRRGLDCTEGNGVRAECIFTDSKDNVRKVSYGWNTSDVATVVLDRYGSKDVAADLTTRTNWLLRAMLANAAGDDDLAIELADNAPKISYTQDFIETEDCQWGTHFSIGDSITWRNLRLNYGPTNDIIAKITFEIDENGFEHLQLTFGDPHPDVADKQRGGGQRRRNPRYTAPDLWHLFGDAGILVPANLSNAVGVVGDGTTITATEDVANRQIELAGVMGGTCYWQRTLGPPNYLHQRTHGDELRLYDGADGLVFKVDASGNITGNRLAVGSPDYETVDFQDYNMQSSVTPTAPGIRDIIMAGHLVSDAQSTGSALLWMGGSNAEDQVHVRNTRWHDAPLTWDGGSMPADSSAFAMMDDANGLRLFKSHDFGMYDGYPGAVGTLFASIDGATGNVALDNAATTKFGSNTLTWPVSAPLVGQVATVDAVSGSAVTLSFGNPALPAEVTASWDHIHLIVGNTDNATATITGAMEGIGAAVTGSTDNATATITGAMADAAPDVTGITSDWTAPAAGGIHGDRGWGVVYESEDLGSTVVGYFELTSHTHTADGNLSVASHGHGNGTLAVGNHVHGAGGLAAASHVHPNGTLAVGLHAHGLTGVTVSTPVDVHFMYADHVDAGDTLTVPVGWVLVSYHQFRTDGTLIVLGKTVIL